VLSTFNATFSIVILTTEGAEKNLGEDPAGRTGKGSEKGYREETASAPERRSQPGLLEMENKRLRGDTRRGL